MKRSLIVLSLAIIVILLQTNWNIAPVDDETSTTSSGMPPRNNHRVSADNGTCIAMQPLLVIELLGGSITNRGAAWSTILNTSGVLSRVVTVAELIMKPEMLLNTTAAVIDASLGSENGSTVDSEFLQTLISSDVSVILTGRAAWLLHRLRGTSLPLATAPSHAGIETVSLYEGAVFLSSPHLLTVPSSLTTESSVQIPLDSVQTETSRLVDLTGSPLSEVSPLRYDSYPLDVFLFSPEDPTLLTTTGRHLVVNILAYASPLRETSISQRVNGQQHESGGFSYIHEPTLEGVYYAVHAKNSLLAGTEWTTWRDSHQSLVDSILYPLLVDLESESGFMNSEIEGVVTLEATAKGLWLVQTMALTGSYNTPELVAYLSNRQVSGGFMDDITVTYHVTEALYTAGSLGNIDTDALESWLRDCVVTTGDPEQLGGAAKSPSSSISSNIYNLQYILSLKMLGKEHSDPLDMATWIFDYTTVSEGSYSEMVNPFRNSVPGTASALATLEEIGWLTSTPRAEGLSWLSLNQMDSGGFGQRNLTFDTVAKTEETSVVALMLALLDETNHNIATDIHSYITDIETSVGFELMDLYPSLMWNYWLTETATYSHTDLDRASIRQFLDSFSTHSQYPSDNLIPAVHPEYSQSQYSMQSVWTHFFAAATTEALGKSHSQDRIDDIVFYMYSSQDSGGHYRLTRVPVGSPHMQYSVAAVEALKLVDELDTIQYRVNLETQVLSGYSSGSWSTEGWTLAPFIGTQSAIDWLCTRTALTLGLINATMASQIAATIDGRLQYNDLWALSRDVATLALLNSSEYKVSLENVDRQAVLAALDDLITLGWLNSSSLWQPVYTSGVLEMISILGLRTEIVQPDVGLLSVGVASVGDLGEQILLDVSVSSELPNHSVMVHAFGSWTLFLDVSDSDTLRIDITDDTTALGPQAVHLSLIDWGHTLDFELLSVEINGTLQGFLTLDTPEVLIGERVNGTVSWSLSTGFEAGMTNLTLRLGDPPFYQEWSYESESPFAFSLPSIDYKAGVHNLTVTLYRSYCDSLVLQAQVTTHSPILTKVVSSSPIIGDVGQQMNIEWSLRFVSNESFIDGQTVTLSVKNSSGHTLHSDLGMSGTGISSFSWTPNQRGNLSYVLEFPGAGPLQASTFTGSLHVYEETEMVWVGTGTQNQYTSVDISLQLRTVSMEPLEGATVHVTVTSPSLFILIDSDFITNETGFITITQSLDENGQYTLEADFSTSEYLKTSTSTDLILSWSSSSLTNGGVPPEGLVGETWTLWVCLRDSTSQPIEGESITLRVIYLPNTVIIEQEVTTNATGHAETVWTGSATGAYRFEADYSGSASRGTADAEQSFDIRMSVFLHITVPVGLTVGTQTWVMIEAEDDVGFPISGIEVSISIRGPGNVSVFSDSGNTAEGQLNLTWTPTVRGVNTMTASCIRQDWYEASRTQEIVDVIEHTFLDIALSEDLLAPTTELMTIRVMDSSLQGIEGLSVATLVTLNGMTLLDVTNTSDALGTFNLSLLLDEPGVLSVVATFSQQDWLKPATETLDTTVSGVTTLDLSTPGQPVEQGSTVGIVATLTDWMSQPLVGIPVRMEVSWSNGTLLTSEVKVTGAAGKCTLPFVFSDVGDFLINATFSGLGLNASSSTSVGQRVYVTPDLVLSHSPTCILGETLQIDIGNLDAYGEFIAGRTLLLTIKIGGSTVFETSAPSEDTLITVHWDPTDRGLATITLLHSGDIHYYTNATSCAVSVLEVVSGDLMINNNPSDLFADVIFIYTLTTAGSPTGVNILFEVLGVDLVPVWSKQAFTNASGMALATYTALDTHGLLTVNAGPEETQFLAGGDVQKQLVIKTQSIVTVSLQPEPACAQTETNITIEVQGELGGLLDGLDVTVSLYNPVGEQIQLGYFSMSIIVTTEDGLAVVTFVPEMAGLYTIDVQSSGSLTVYGFTESAHETVHSSTSLIISLSDHDIEVNETVDITVQLIALDATPLVGRYISLLLNGPGASQIGPISLVTNGSGHAFWTEMISEEGLWILEGHFAGLGVYLPVTESADIDVRFGTDIELEVLHLNDVIAGETPTTLSVLLMDSAGTPLEGFSMDYEAYHETVGFTVTDSFIQTGQEPFLLNITLSRGGNFTIVLIFAGTSHYHGSMAAATVWVVGTSSIEITGPTSSDRSDDANVSVIFRDEMDGVINTTTLTTELSLIGPSGVIDVSPFLVWNHENAELLLKTLPVGSYALNVNILEDAVRLGSKATFRFNITTVTRIETLKEALPGLVVHSHLYVFKVIDSMNESLVGLTAWVSLFTPDGREVWGSPMTEKKYIAISSAGIEVSWTPSSTGVYRLVVGYDGDDYRNATESVLEILTRHETQLEVQAISEAVYGESVVVTVRLMGGLGNINGAEIQVHVDLEGVVERIENTTTQSLGTVRVSFEGLGAGNHTVKVYYPGDDTFAPASTSIFVVIAPKVSVSMTVVNAFVNTNTTVSFSVEVGGIDANWTGTLDVYVFNPEGILVTSINKVIEDVNLVTLSVIPELDGQYSVNVTISDLPFSNEDRRQLSFNVSNPPPVIQLDGSTMPLTGGFIVMVIIGLIISRKYGRMITKLPSEWK